MNLEKLIPNNPNWKARNGYIYFHKYIDIPIAKIEDNSLLIFFDKCVYKQVNQLITKLIKSNIEFYLIDAIFSQKRKCDDKFYHYFNILNYLYNYSEPGFFDHFKKINFDLVDNLTKYMQKNNCLYLLDPAYDHLKKDALVQYNGYIGYSWIQNIHKIEREDIRTELEGIEREIKINLLV